MGIRHSMATFAKFCAANPAQKVKIVRDRPAWAYYSPLTNFLQTYHWNTNDLETLERNIDGFVTKQGKRGHHFSEICDAYVKFWRSREASYFRVIPIDIEIGGLVISVNPEIGMRTPDGDCRAMKLWFNVDRPTKLAKQVLLYLMESARANDDRWPSDWDLKVWDVRAKNLIATVQLPADFELALTAEATSFLFIRNNSIFADDTTESNAA